jgi:hypothetical protein
MKSRLLYALLTAGAATAASIASLALGLPAWLAAALGILVMYCALWARLLKRGTFVPKLAALELSAAAAVILAVTLVVSAWPGLLESAGFAIGLAALSIAVLVRVLRRRRHLLDVA